MPKGIRLGSPYSIPSSLKLKGKEYGARFTAASADEDNRSSCTSVAAIAAPPSPIVCRLVEASTRKNVLEDM